MTKAEAKSLAEQLGWDVSGVSEFDDAIERSGYILAMDNVTADWVVLDSEKNELARCE